MRMQMPRGSPVLEISEKADVDQFINVAPVNDKQTEDGPEKIRLHSLKLPIGIFLFYKERQIRQRKLIPGMLFQPEIRRKTGSDPKFLNRGVAQSGRMHYQWMGCFSKEWIPVFPFQSKEVTLYMSDALLSIDELILQSAKARDSCSSICVVTEQRTSEESDLWLGNDFWGKPCPNFSGNGKNVRFYDFRVRFL